MQSRTGGCSCGALRYTLHGEPTHVGRCHCADCRKRSGSTYTIYGHWPREAFELDGEPATFGDEHFCRTCGSHIGLIEAELVEIYLGTLDAAPFGLVPQAELWVKRREPWVHPVEGASQHQENRPT
jgi:hypothetical protein